MPVSPSARFRETGQKEGNHVLNPLDGHARDAAFKSQKDDAVDRGEKRTCHQVKIMGAGLGVQFGQGFRDDRKEPRKFFQIPGWHATVGGHLDIEEGTPQIRILGGEAQVGVAREP